MNLFKLYTRVPPDHIVQALNILVNQLNTVFTQIANGNPGIFPPTVVQLNEGLNDSTSVGYDPNGLVATNIPASQPYSPIYTEWTQAPFFVQGSSLYNFVQTQLGLTTAQMQTFYASLTNYPVGP